MKILLAIILSTTFLLSLDIDPKMFEDQKREGYLQELEKRLQTDQKKGEQESLVHEKYYLNALQESIRSTETIKRPNLSKLSAPKLTLAAVYKEFLNLYELKKRINTQIELQNEVQSKLSVIKRKIENYVQESEESALLLQLQFAFFKVQQENISKRELTLNQHYDELYDGVYASIERIQLKNEKSLDKKIEELSKRAQSLLNQSSNLQLTLQEAKLKEKESIISELSQKLEKSEARRLEQLSQFIDLQINRVFYFLLQEQEDEYIKQINEIEELIKGLDAINRLKYRDQVLILKDFAKQKFGRSTLIFSRSAFEFEALWERTKKLFTGTLFVFNEQVITLLSLLKAISLIILGFAFGFLYKRWLLHISKKWDNKSEMTIKITSNVGYYFIIFLTLMIAISSLGIDLTSLSLIAGALSIGIGFGLQTIVSNFISGIILMFEKTMRIGDVIEVDGVQVGTVTDIRMRSTTIKTFDNIDIVIPNSSFIQNNVTNLTLDDRTRRLHIPFGVAYGTEVDQIRSLILEELDHSDLIYVRNNPDKQPEVRMSGMGASSVDYELLVWVRTNDRYQNYALSSDFLILIYKALNKHEISIPFPQLDVHMIKKDE